MKLGKRVLVTFALFATSPGWATETGQTAAAAPQPGMVEKVGNAVERGVAAAAGGVQRGASAAASGVQRGVSAATRGVKIGAQAAAQGVGVAASATARAADKTARALGVDGTAPPTTSAASAPDAR